MNAGFTVFVRRQALLPSRWRSWIALSAVAIVLAGCGDGGTMDLREFIEEARQRQGRVEPLPAFEQPQVYTYAALDRRDPFVPERREAIVMSSASEGTDVAPNADRPREALEAYPLDALSMLGTLVFEDATWGLVKAPDGIVHRIRAGNHLGQNYGKVKAIQSHRLLLTEIVPDGLGGWEEREASLAMNP